MIKILFYKWRWQRLEWIKNLEKDHPLMGSTTFDNEDECLDGKLESYKAHFLHQIKRGCTHFVTSRMGEVASLIGHGVYKGIWKPEDFDIQIYEGDTLKSITVDDKGYFVGLSYGYFDPDIDEIMRD
jgi:hypothetical protein